MSNHDVSISRSAIQMHGLHIHGQVNNFVEPAWYIRCNSCGWVEKAGTETTAIARAERHKKGAKLP